MIYGRGVGGETSGIVPINSFYVTCILVISVQSLLDHGWRANREAALMQSFRQAMAVDGVGQPCQGRKEPPRTSDRQTTNMLLLSATAAALGRAKGHHRRPLCTEGLKLTGPPLLVPGMSQFEFRVR